MKTNQARLFRICNTLVMLILLLSVLGVDMVSADLTQWIQVTISATQTHSVYGWNWLEHIPVTLTIAHPDAPENPYYSDMTTPAIVPGLEFPRFNFKIPKFINIQTGDIVTVTNGTLTKTHVFKFAQITRVDTVNDRVFGKNEPYVQVHVSVMDAFSPNQHAYRHVYADEAGNWLLPNDDRWRYDKDPYGKTPDDYKHRSGCRRNHRNIGPG